MKYAYPATLKRDEIGRVVVAFRDVPEALTDGADEAEALREAQDALVAALAFYVERRKEIPRPSPARGRRLVVLPPLVAAKLALYSAMRRQKISNVALGQKLGLSEGAIRRLVNPDHASKIEKVYAALAAIDVILITEDEVAA